MYQNVTCFPITHKFVHTSMHFPLSSSGNSHMSSSICKKEKNSTTCLQHKCRKLDYIT